MPSHALRAAKSWSRYINFLPCLCQFVSLAGCVWFAVFTYDSLFVCCRCMICPAAETGAAAAGRTVRLALEVHDNGPPLEPQALRELFTKRIDNLGVGTRSSHSVTSIGALFYVHL